jgi:tetratricopeptide (TPR) repeat protein
MNTPHRQIWILICLLCLGHASTFSIRAQTNPSATISPDAQAAVDKGVIAAKEQEWEIAIQNFQDARKLAPNTPEIFYDLGLAESKMPGRELRAIAWFGAYLAANPNAPNAAAVSNFITALQVKNQGNLNRMFKTLQDSAVQVSTAPPALQSVAVLRAECGDINGALETADLCQNAGEKGLAQVGIGSVQITEGDISGANSTFAMALTNGQNSTASAYNVLFSVAEAQASAGEFMAAMHTADLISDAYWKNVAQKEIAEEQIKRGDMDGAQMTLAAAQKTAGLLTGAQKITCQTDIANDQVKAGGISGAKMAAESALSIARNMADDDSQKPLALSQIATVLAGAGDIEEAQSIASRIGDTAFNLKDYALAAVVNAQAKAGDYDGAKKTNDRIKTASIKVAAVVLDTKSRNLFFPDNHAKTSAATSPNSGSPSNAETNKPVVKLADWLEKLDDHVDYFDCALNTRPFLDITGYLTAQRSDDPRTLFEQLRQTVEKLVKAQNIIDLMLKQQAKQQAGP